MSAKQDRVAPRTAEDVERRHNNQSFAEAVGIATDARRTAEIASEEVKNCRTEIVNLAESITLRVTGNEEGTAASIVLTVGEEEYSGEINLTGLVTFESLQTDGATQINGDNIVSEGFDENGHQVRLTMNGGKLLFEKKENGIYTTVTTIDINGSISRIAVEQGLEVFGRKDSYFGSPNSPTKIYGSEVDIDGDRLFIKGRHCMWLPNGDGTHSLVTTDDGQGG